MPDESAKTVAEGWWNSFVGKDVRGACAHYADDVDYVDHGVGQSFPGREAVEGFWQSFFDVIDVDAFTADLHAFTTTETTFAVEWTMRFQLVKPWGEFPSSPNVVALRGISVGDVAGGKIVSHRDYYNAASILQQMGLLAMA
jgi:steroid delta-isomerase-like uncharacterized protein